MDRIKAYLLMRVGPLPLWGWLLIFTAGVAAFLWWRKNKGGSSSGLGASGSGQGGVASNPPFQTEPPISGGRQEPGWSGPNTNPGWNMPPLPAAPGPSFDPPLSDSGGFSNFPSVTVPQLPTFDAIPPMTPGTAIPTGTSRTTTAYATAKHAAADAVKVAAKAKADAKKAAAEANKAAKSSRSRTLDAAKAARAAVQKAAAQVKPSPAPVYNPPAPVYKPPPSRPAPSPTPSRVVGTGARPRGSFA